MGEKESAGKPNPKSGQIWHYGGVDKDGSVTGTKDRDIFRRTMSTVAIQDGLVYAADLTGFVHCVDLKTGKRIWEHDIFGGVWGSTMYVDGNILIGNEEGILSVLTAGREKPKVQEIELNSSVYSTPTIANGVMYISDRSNLYAIKITNDEEK